MTRKLDRRVIRTRRLLRESLLALIVEQGYDSVTITDITARADLRRATFYLHYADKEELMVDALTGIFDDLVERVEPHLADDALGGKTEVSAFEVVFRYVGENADLYRAILGGHGTIEIVRRIRSYLAGLVLRGLERHSEPTPVPPVVLAHYVAGAELAMISWWLDNDCPYSADTMAVMVHQLVLNGVRLPISEN